MPIAPPAPLWTPDPTTARGTAIAAFAHRVAGGRGVPVDELDYAALHAWSVADLEGFWAAVADFCGVRFHDAPTATLGSRAMPGARWFPGATLNYAEHALAPGKHGDRAVVLVREGAPDRTVTRGELRALVARARAGLVRAGVGRGDRVAALAPNCLETLATFLAAASLGAVWSSCSPDFGARAVHDRFAQIEPVVLLAVDGYRYGSRGFDVRTTVTQLQERLPSVRATVLVPYLDPDATLDDTVGWAEFTAEPGPLEFTPVPFDHPLWVLYSSGTTGLPKGIVHGHGGIVVEHLKTLRLHLDLGPDDGFLWFTTTGWMMWNLLVGGLMTGAAVVLFDGNPGHPDLDVLWAVAARHRVTVLGVSAPFVHASMKAEVQPRARHDLSALRIVGSTGSPLSSEGYRWIAAAVGEHVQISSVSGGTDVCTAFLTSAPTVPVRIGELSCAGLGMDVHAVDERGADVVGNVGELVVDLPAPSMPVALWNDPDGTRLRETYFAEYPGRWRHGDWVSATTHGSFVVHGRSDATLNRGGVRMGTAEFYAVVEAFDEVVDSLVVDTTAAGAHADGALLCFLVLADGLALDDVEPVLRRALRAELSPRHLPDRFVVVPAIPRTLTGKKCEIPVKRILAGDAPDRAVSADALQDPDALRPFVALAAAAGR